VQLVDVCLAKTVLLSFVAAKCRRLKCNDDILNLRVVYCVTQTLFCIVGKNSFFVNFVCRCWRLCTQFWLVLSSIAEAVWVKQLRLAESRCRLLLFVNRRDSCVWICEEKWLSSPSAWNIWTRSVLGRRAKTACSIWEVLSFEYILAVQALDQVSLVQKKLLKNFTRAATKATKIGRSEHGIVLLLRH